MSASRWKCITYKNSRFSQKNDRFSSPSPTLVGAGCVYFGKELSNAMLFEPTETETKEELDNLVRIIEEIVDEAYKDKTIMKKHL